MSFSDVSLSTSSRASLTSLQQTASALEAAQKRLSTGKKVNSAQDGAVAFLQSQAFLDRASDLSNVKDTTSTALQTINVANTAIKSVSTLVDQAKGITTAALQTQDPTQRAAYAQQFDDLRSQIDQLVGDASLNGRNLIDGTSGNLTVNFNPDNTSSLTVNNTNLTSSGLGIAASSNAFVSDTDITAAVGQLSTALNTLRTTSASLGSNADVITTRQDFTTNLINNLQTSADNLTLDDINEEAANLLSLQAKNSLSLTSLSISTKQQQNVIKLF